MNTIWILGIGPLIVHRLFLQDVKRLDIFINNVLMPKNEYIVLEYLYKLFGNKYLFYTKYISQRLGNKVFNELKEQYDDKHLICKNYNICVSRGLVEAHMFFDIYNKELKWIKKIKVQCKVDEAQSTTLIVF